MSDIFLGYANTDLQRVLPRVRALEKRGWSVWWDRTIPPGQLVVADDRGGTGRSAVCRGGVVGSIGIVVLGGD